MTKEEIDKIILKAKVCNRLLEIETWQFTKAEIKVVTSYYINIKDNEYILYIPDEVTSIAPRRSTTIDRLFKSGSKVKIIGGKNLNVARQMFYFAKLEELDLTETEFTRNLKLASRMFYKSHIRNIIGATFDITNCDNRYDKEMFYGSNLGETNLSIRMNNNFELPFVLSSMLGEGIDMDTDMNIFNYLICNSLHLEIDEKYPDTNYRPLINSIRDCRVCNRITSNDSRLLELLALAEEFN